MSSSLTGKHATSSSLNLDWRLRHSEKMFVERLLNATVIPTIIRNLRCPEKNHLDGKTYVFSSSSRGKILEEKANVLLHSLPESQEAIKKKTQQWGVRDLNPRKANYEFAA